jgi:hypothetical protein
MTAKNPDAKLVAPLGIQRPVHSWRLRQDFIDIVEAECQKLNCSRGVYFEVLLLKSWNINLITADDVFSYDSEERRKAVLSVNAKTGS